ncbi:hypothetical protein BD770DRAFT_172089 [Pilaira anomala]|nr:hypothetical protein BD770DRAFT_172089 [Pilaira anomala]
MNKHNVLTAPNKTLTAPPSTSRRPSSFKTNTTPLTSPRSPSLELSDSFSVLSPLSQQPSQTLPKQYTSNHKPPLEYHQFFSSTQLASIKPICSSTTLTDWEFLSLEKYPASHNSQDAYDLEMTTIGLSIELGTPFFHYYFFFSCNFFSVILKTLLCVCVCVCVYI